IGARVKSVPGGAHVGPNLHPIGTNKSRSRRSSRRAESPSHGCQQIPGTGHDHHGGAYVGWRLRARQVPVAGRLSSSRIQAGTESPPYEPQPCSHFVGTNGTESPPYESSAVPQSAGDLLALTCSVPAWLRLPTEA